MSGDTDVDKWIELTKDCKYLPEHYFKKLCDLVLDYLIEESNVHPVYTPVTICGDIHGQYYDLQVITFKLLINSVLSIFLLTELLNFIDLYKNNKHHFDLD